MNKLKRKSQSALEATLVFAAAMAILGAAMAIWGWGNAHIPVRQVTYNATRVMAGQSSRSVSEQGAQKGSKQEVWPTYIAAPVP